MPRLFPPCLLSPHLPVLDDACLLLITMTISLILPKPQTNKKQLSETGVMWCDQNQGVGTKPPVWTPWPGAITPSCPRADALYKAALPTPVFDRLDSSKSQPHPASGPCSARSLPIPQAPLRQEPQTWYASQLCPSPEPGDG